MWKKGILAVCGALLLAATSQAAVTVTGTGKVKYTPDVAHLSFGVSHQAKSAAEAWKLNAEAVKKIFAALKELGIDEKDLQTAHVNVSPVYDHHLERKAPVLVGYVATYELNVTKIVSRLSGRSVVAVTTALVPVARMVSGNPSVPETFRTSKPR